MMATGDTIETIEIIDPNSVISMNNSKDITAFKETGDAVETEGDYIIF